MRPLFMSWINLKWLFVFNGWVLGEKVKTEDVQLIL